MTNVILFEPINTNNPSLNVEGFIEFCKSNIFNSKLAITWESNVWKGCYRFNKFDMKNNRNSKDRLNDSFIDFAKAYMFHIHSFNKSKSNQNALAMLKIVEFVLLKSYGEAKVVKCNNNIFDECVRIASAKYTKSQAVGIGKELEKLCSFLSENRMTSSSYFFWVSPLRHKITQSWQGYEPSLEGHSKLPDIKSVIAIAEIFSKDESQLSVRDIFTTSVLALLMCAPGRISEILSLPADCEITEHDENRIERYGLRFFSAKGYAGDIKWIPSVMVPVAKKAIARLRKLSTHPRFVAKTMEGKVPESYRHELFTKKPQNFPWYDEEKKIKYSNTLCLLFEGQLCQKTNKHLAPLFRPTAQFFRLDIDAFASIKGTTNLFKRHGYINEDGSPYSLRTHQLRHLLNTFSQISGMDEFSIARWSGRKQVSQNVSYDHRSHLQMINLMKDKTSIGPGNSHRKKEIAVMDITDFDLLNDGAVLVTKHGYCKHSYVFEPCSYYPLQDSGTDDGQLMMIHTKILEKTNYDKNDGNVNADKWYKFQTKIIKGE
ncbi:DNA-binding protein [Pantoea agglomerans]|uniref:DNA-binding protein n=1 Tax=Enterobacter agglomerans TaxID=549 RepID=UPI00045C46AD|nr:DNA-binding protein [Pantoea agglomerans]KDA94334.1 DNA-binding protein [Pantoea agglomerans Eh318]